MNSSSVPDPREERRSDTSPRNRARLAAHAQRDAGTSIAFIAMLRFEHELASVVDGSARAAARAATVRATHEGGFDG